MRLGTARQFNSVLLEGAGSWELGQRKDARKDLQFALPCSACRSPFDAASRRTKLRASRIVNQEESLMWICVTAKPPIIGVNLPTLAFSRLAYF